jgi:hypothetical protein
MLIQGNPRELAWYKAVAMNGQLKLSLNPLQLLLWK